MNHPIPATMKGPSDMRPCWRGGVMQIHVTRACDKACFGCTQGSNLGGRPVVMSLEHFEQACRSLKGYFGVVGVFGGNPAMHPKFDALCEILRSYFPKEQCGLWCNNLRGQGYHARKTFNPRVSNLNVHLDQVAYDEFLRDWPETAACVRADGTGNLKGDDRDARHGPPFVAMHDVIHDEEERWALIGDCDVNQRWSAMICVVRDELRAFPCELMGAMAMLHQDNPNWMNTGKPMPDYGVDVVRDWWRAPMGQGKFADAVRNLCHACGMPLRGYGELAIGGKQEQFSETHKFIAKPKTVGRPVELVTLRSQLDERPDTHVTDYMEKGAVCQ